MGSAEKLKLVFSPYWILSKKVNYVIGVRTSTSNYVHLLRFSVLKWSRWTPYDVEKFHPVCGRVVSNIVSNVFSLSQNSINNGISRKLRLKLLPKIIKEGKGRENMLNSVDCKWQLNQNPGGTSYNGPYGEAPPERKGVTSSGFKYKKGRDFTS